MIRMSKFTVLSDHTIYVGLNPDNRVLKDVLCTVGIQLANRVTWFLALWVSVVSPCIQVLGSGVDPHHER